MSDSISENEVSCLESESFFSLLSSDVYYQSYRQDIGRILHAQSLSMALATPVRRTLETKNVILVALSVIIAAAFTTVCNLPASFMVKNIDYHVEFGARDVISAQLPSVFYLMVFNTAVFMVCLVVILALLWPLPLRPVFVFLTSTFGIVYCILVNNAMPKLLVRVGSGTIMGTTLVGLLAVAFICLEALLYYGFSYGYRIMKRVFSKTKQGVENMYYQLIMIYQS